MSDENLTRPLRMHDVVSSAPCKVILSGEHAVVHGASAIALCIDLRTTVRLTPLPATDNCLLRYDDHTTHRIPHSLVIHIATAFKSTPSPPDSHLLPPLDDHPLSSRIFIYLFASIVATNTTSELWVTPIAAHITTNIPVAAGLGSSASYAVALAAAFLHAMHPTRAADQLIINAFAHQAERITHGEPSGLDTFVISNGGAVRYRRHSPPVPLRVASAFNLIVVNTGVARRTRALVEHVAALHSTFPLITGPIFSAMDAITGEMEDALKLGEIPRDLITANHYLLCALGLSHERFDTIMAMAESHGAVCKMTGAGKGGCMIIVGAGDKLLGELRSAGFDAFETVFTDVGVRVDGADVGDGVSGEWIEAELYDH